MRYQPRHNRHQNNGSDSAARERQSNDWSRQDEDEAFNTISRFQIHLRPCTCRTHAPSQYHEVEGAHEQFQPYLSTRSSSYFCALQRNRYESLALAQFAMATFERDQREWASFQRSALQQWRSSSRVLVRNLRHGGHRQGYQALRDCHSIINRIFFLGQIKLASLEWVENLGNGSRLGDCTALWNGVRIRLNSDLHEDDGELAVGTLIHEMTHAFLQLYGCRNTSSDACSCFDLRSINNGKKGHGRAWQRLIAAIASFARDYMDISLPLDEFVNLQYSAQYDIRRGGPHPSACDIANSFARLQLNSCPRDPKD